MLKELRDRPELTGNDFLPLLVRLDDLFAHFKTVRELIDQLDGLRAAAQVGAIVSGGTMAVQAMDVSRVLMQRPVQDVTSGLESLAQRIAGEYGKKVRFEVRGLELIERHLGWLDRPPTPKSELEFTSAAAHILRRLVAQGRSTRSAGAPGSASRCGASRRACSRRG